MKLDDRYLLEQGTVFLSGMQALVRLPIDQNRRDRAAGLKTATFISGYPGSPLAGYDLALSAARPIIERHDILHVPGANEELAATAISGTQMLDNFPHARIDGVIALWYGKGPGVDRSGDALKHGNFAGTSKHGAVVVLSGDDHEAKSSTMPFQDDYAFVSVGIPVIYPSSVAEFLELGLHAIAMSRYSGCWVAMKLVSALADGGETVRVWPEQPCIKIPELEINGRPFRKATDFMFYPGLNVETERKLYYERHAAVRAYAQANRLDQIAVRSPDDRLGIIAAGKSYTDLLQAFLEMEFDDADMRRHGIRLLRIGLIYPIDAVIVREFAGGLDEIIVIEEKRGFLEAQVKEALCSRPVRVIGKFDEEGAPLFPIQGGMDSDVITERLASRLLKYAPGHPGVLRRLEELQSILTRQYGVGGGRNPNYCSGCPHNVSTRLLDGQLAMGSPGCHAFATLIEQPERHIVSMTQLGGEGVRWIGLAPFTERRHMVQNVGDGSLFHSSYLNIRFCIAAGANITFKILYNGYVANTGAQEMVGGKPIPGLTRLLELEGVKRIALLTKDPDAYRGAGLASNAQVYTIVEQDRVLKELEQQTGVTVLIYDGLCANERRRRQKRGKLALPHRFVVINQEVCEGCGHCGALTNCMSLHPVETEFGRKTQIHPSSCNQDYSCLGGDCPSFVTVETKPGTGYRQPAIPLLEESDIPESTKRADLGRPYHIYIPGVGGTGVITLNALLCHAALAEGKHVLSYDQTGSAQKWGPVLSSLIVAADGQKIAAGKVAAGKADLYLACDLMAAATPVNLERCDPRRTAAVINTTVFPSGEMIRQVDYSVPPDAMQESIRQYINAERSIAIEARRFAEGLFGDHLATNLFMLGVAYQAGLLPVAAKSIEAAIHLNNVQVRQNAQAFRYGRLYVADPEHVQRLVGRPVLRSDEEQARVLTRLRGKQGGAYKALMNRCMQLDEESRRMLAIRIGELIDYQDIGYAQPYLDFVMQVAGREQRVIGESREVTHAVIRNLYKLMAYKDEYEVARLQLKRDFQEDTRKLFVAPRRLVYHFHPPLLRAVGLKRKLEFGPWFTPVLRLLRSMRFLRRSKFDLFGYAQVRKEERRLVEWYKALVASALERLGSETYAVVVEIAQLPDHIRGYEEIKLENVKRTGSKADTLMERLNIMATAQGIN